MEQRKQAPKEQQKGFDSIIILMIWILWKEMNTRVFKRISSSLAAKPSSASWMISRNCIMTGYKHLALGIRGRWIGAYGRGFSAFVMNPMVCTRSPFELASSSREKKTKQLCKELMHVEGPPAGKHFNWWTMILYHLDVTS